MKKSIFETIGIITVTLIVLLAAYINMVLEPKCEEKGYANVDVDGCYIMQNGERVYENVLTHPTQEDNH